MEARATGAEATKINFYSGRSSLDLARVGTNSNLSTIARSFCLLGGFDLGRYRPRGPAITARTKVRPYGKDTLLVVGAEAGRTVSVGRHTETSLTTF